jgi:TPR repeat protein
MHDPAEQLLRILPRGADDIRIAPRIRGWRERSATSAEQWLRSMATDGDVYAMERLGERLLIGDGLEQCTEDGMRWLERAADRGSPRAMTYVAEYLLATTPSARCCARAAEWLRVAASSNYLPAAICLGVRLTIGQGLVADPDEGKSILTHIASQGSRLARARLAAMLLSGASKERDRQQALRLLAQLGANDGAGITRVGHYLYMKSLAAHWQSRLLAQEAAALFKEAIARSYAPARINLAYLVRRGECAGDASLDQLLQNWLDAGDTFAILNQALRLARGVQCHSSWKQADRLLTELSNSQANRALLWWWPRACEGDAEGHLVTAWLGRHSLVVDPEESSLKMRMERARAGGWSAPRWMDERRATHALWMMLSRAVCSTSKK